MNSKYLAGISLAIMAAGFLVTLFFPENTFVFLLKGGFEAGLVGGIADWFAVTALFRHPFSIPIPHTALLLKNKSRIIQSLISAMENELLNKESIENKLSKLHVLRMASVQLTKLMGRKKARIQIADFLVQLVLRLPLANAVPVIQSWLVSYLQKTDMKVVAESVITKVMNDGYDEKALDFVLGEAANWAARPETGVMLGKLAIEKLSEVKAGGFMGFALQAFGGLMNEDKLGSILQNMILGGINDLKVKENTYREMIIREIRIQLFQLADNENQLLAAKNWAIERIAGESGEAFLQARLEDIRSLALARLEQEKQNGGRSIFRLYRAVIRHLALEPEKIDEWESRLLAYLIQLVESNHFRIGQLVKENLDQMDDAALVSMLEEKVGQDLQWIRVNGALCGFVVGIILSAIQLLS
ncbi:DUF445 domain-containing protein [Paenibacillus nasutitermitis]|uniref:DUF445 domain-containing protein n=1 Tax=Paenibacillus nasutitermitis TaxID=1652958 RepID=A0A917DPK7_9BACL|nr:DUF445 family protein [Paenibacillus nasutitermitis]GGD54286.1 hypothetical protein GCM10010911_09820 [Paenibacillus nasutitermitis]